MAIDPFTQQIVQFYSCPTVIESERATVPFSNNYTAGFREVSDGSRKLDPQMQSAMYIGLLGPLANTSAAVEVECSTGNCTFPSADDGATFQSLALESQCTDIGSEINFTTNRRNGTFCVDLGEPSDYSSPGRACYDNQTYTTSDATLMAYNLSLTNYSSSTEGQVVMRSGRKFVDPRPSLGATTIWDDSNGEWVVIEPEKKDGPWWPLSFLTTVSYLMTYADHLAEPQYTHAFKCEFFPAVQTYSAIIRNGVLLEQVLDTQRMGVWPWHMAGLTALLPVDRTIREGKWHECTSSLSQSNEHNLPVNISVDPSLSINGSMIATAFPPEELTSPFNNITWWPQDCVYWLSNQITDGLTEAISNILGSETLLYEYQEEATPWTLNMWNNGTPTLEGIQATMDGMTRSVTARLRQGDGVSVNKGPAIGTVWGIQTCVHVNWGWIGLPVGLLLFTIVFLILTIVKTRSKQARVWKSSIFAVLFSGLDQEARKADGPLVSLQEMKAAAGRATVRLEDTKEGFRLVSQA